MPDLDYGYEVTIAQNAVFDPSGTASNQWQRQVPGNVKWENIANSTNSTYTVSAADRSARIRLEQSLNGAKAYSNELTVTSTQPPESPCNKIGDEPTKIFSSGPIQTMYGESNITVIAGKNWLKYLSGYSSSFSNGSVPPNFSDSNSSGLDQIYALGRTPSRWVIVSKAGDSWTNSNGYSSWTRSKGAIYGAGYSTKSVASDGSAVLAVGTAVSPNRVKLVYSTNGSSWLSPSLNLGSDISNVRVNGGDGYFAVQGGNNFYYNETQGSYDRWIKFTAPTSTLGSFGHLGMLYQSGSKYKIFDPRKGTTIETIYPWLEGAGNGYDITGVSPQSHFYSGGIYFVSANKGVLMSSCNGVNWKLHRNPLYTSENTYAVRQGFLANQGRWIFREYYSFFGNGSVSWIT